jgi:streptogrisin D
MKPAQRSSRVIFAVVSASSVIALALLALPQATALASTNTTWDRVVTNASAQAGFAGAWREGAKGVIVFTSARAAKQVAVSPEVEVRILPAWHSASQLRNIESTVLGSRGRDLDHSAARFAYSYIDVKTNSIRVGLTGRTSALALAYERRYGKTVKTEEASVGPAAGVPPTTSFTVKGGQYIDNGATACSAAFSVDLSSSSVGAKGAFYTAGHCFALQDGVEDIYGSQVGTVSQRTYTNCANTCPADVEYVPMASTPLLGAYGYSTNQLSNGSRITSVDLGPYSVGEQICKMGNTSGTTCGTILATGVTVCYSTSSCFGGTLEVSIDFCHGDSGGPVYYNGAAMGIVSGRGWGSGGEPACGGAHGFASTMAGVRSAGYTTNIDVTN